MSKDETKPEKKVTCCGGLEQLEEKGYPFGRPMRVNMETGGVTFNDWAVHVHKLTPSGELSRSKKAQVFVTFNFCPFCGARIRTELPKLEQQSIVDEAQKAIKIHKRVTDALVTAMDKPSPQTKIEEADMIDRDSAEGLTLRPVGSHQTNPFSTTEPKTEPGL